MAIKVNHGVIMQELMAIKVNHAVIMQELI